jgi:hypothetical protein
MSKPDENTLPGSSGPTLDKAGIKASGYLDKKGVPSGDYIFNRLPPGTDIENQECADIRELPKKEIVAGSYPGDGWS